MPKFQKGDIIETILVDKSGKPTLKAKIVGISTLKYTLEYDYNNSRRLEYITEVDATFKTPKEYDNPLWRKLEGKD